MSVFLLFKQKISYDSLDNDSFERGLLLKRKLNQTHILNHSNTSTSTIFVLLSKFNSVGSFFQCIRNLLSFEHIGQEHVVNKSFEAIYYRNHLMALFCVSTCNRILMNCNER